MGLAVILAICQAHHFPEGKRSLVVFQALISLLRESFYPCAQLSVLLRIQESGFLLGHFNGHHPGGAEAATPG